MGRRLKAAALFKGTEMKHKKAEEPRHLDFATHREMAEEVARSVFREKMLEADEFGRGVYEAFVHKYGRFERHEGK